MDFVMVYCTVGKPEEGARIARELVERRLAACVNVIAGVSSTYRWQGQIEQDQESLLLIKTRAERFAELDAVIRSLHSYQVPEIIAVPISAGSQSYLDWLQASVPA